MTASHSEPDTLSDSDRDPEAPVEAVVFDWGGTLSLWAEIEMEDMWRLAADHVAADTGADPAEVLRGLVDVEERLWEACAGTDGARSFRLVDVFESASDALGVDVAEAVLEEAAAHHLDTWTPHIRHDPDAAPVLSALKDMGLRTGLLSNTHWPEHFHEHFLERDALLGHLDVRMYSSNEPQMKPHPRIFGEVLARLGAEPAYTLFVGDRQHDDIRGAQGVGMRGVWKRTTHSWEAEGVEPDYVVETLPELLDLCRRLGTR